MPAPIAVILLMICAPFVGIAAISMVAGALWLLTYNVYLFALCAIIAFAIIYWVFESV